MGIFSIILSLAIIEGIEDVNYKLGHVKFGVSLGLIRLGYSVVFDLYSLG